MGIAFLLTAVVPNPWLGYLTYGLGVGVGAAAVAPRQHDRARPQAVGEIPAQGAQREIAEARDGEDVDGPSCADALLSIDS